MILTLALALALSQVDHSPLVRVRDASAARVRGREGVSYAFFEAFPVGGAGTFGACSTTPPTGAKGEALVFARSTVKWCTNDDYSLTQMAINQPVIMRGRPGAPLGIYVEQDATNSILNNRDLSQAQFIKTSMTCAKTATGADGVTNSASTCTASGANGTALQAIVRASAKNSSSLYIKRRTGTGAIAVTRDNGTTWNTITSSVDTNWKRVVCKDAEGCMGGRCIVVTDMCATSTNPTVGIRLSTSGDAVDVDLVQNELGGRASSPITTAGTATPRAYDYGYFDIGTPPATVTSWRVSQVMSSVEAISEYGLFVSAGSDWLAVFTGTSLPVAESLMNIGCNAFLGGAQYGHSPQVPLAAGGLSSTSCSYPSGSRYSCANGVCYAATVASIPAFTRAATRVNVGLYPPGGSTYAYNGVISEVCLGVEGGRNCEQTKPAPSSANHIAWIGDSISSGVNSTPTFPPVVLYSTWAQLTSRSVQNFAIGGGTADLCTANWNSLKTAGGFSSLVMLCGINDIKGGAAASTVWPKLKAILDEAHALGYNVTPITLLPWSNWADGLTNWSAAKQTETESLNNSIMTWCSDNGETCVDAYNSAFRSGTALAAIYDIGDGLHPNAAGSTLLATLVQAASP